MSILLSSILSYLFVSLFVAIYSAMSGALDLYVFQKKYFLWFLWFLFLWLFAPIYVLFHSLIKKYKIAKYGKDKPKNKNMRK